MPVDDEYEGDEDGRIINFNNKEETKYFHIYYYDNNREIKRENKNYITQKIRKIMVSIDSHITSINKIFYNCNSY